MPADFTLDLSPLAGFIDTTLAPAIDARMIATGEAMAEQARQSCPVRTGRLQASIGSEYDPATQTVTVSATAPYALDVELGWNRQTANGRVVDVAAEPFLRGSLGAVAEAWSG